MFPLLLIRIQELFDKKLSHIDFRTEFADQGKSLQGIPVFFGYVGKNALGMFDGFQNVIFYRGQVFFDVSGNRFINIGNPELLRAEVFILCTLPGSGRAVTVAELFCPFFLTSAFGCLFFSFRRVC